MSIVCKIDGGDLTIGLGSTRRANLCRQLWSYAWTSDKGAQLVDSLSRLPAVQLHAAVVDDPEPNFESFADSEEAVRLDARLAEALWQWNETHYRNGSTDARLARTTLAQNRVRALRTAVLSEATGVFATRDALVLLARDARSTWATFLLGDVDEPMLLPNRQTDEPTPFQTDDALDELLLVCSSAPRRRWWRLTLGDEGPLMIGGDERGTREHRRVVSLARQAYLPRFRLLRMWAAARAPRRRKGRLPRGESAVAVLALAFLALTALAATWWALAADRGSWPASGWGLGWLVIGFAGAPFAAILGLAVFGRGYITDALCLRVPASIALGASILLTLRQWYPNKTDPDSWSIPWWIAVVLLAVALGYMMVEARNHGVDDARQIVSRTAGVFVLAVLYAIAVTSIVLAVLAPWFASEFTIAVNRLQPGWPRLSLLATASATSLCVGVFLQVLWDDKPITYPLSHLEARGSS